MQRVLAALFCAALLCCPLETGWAATKGQPTDFELIARERAAELAKLARENKAKSGAAKTKKKAQRPSQKVSSPKKDAVSKGRHAPTTLGKTSSVKTSVKKATVSKKRESEKAFVDPSPAAAPKDQTIPTNPQGGFADLVVRPAEAVEFWHGDFARGPVKLFLWPDHFFVLELGLKKPRTLTGLWRQSQDGVRLDLVNAQDLAIGISRGKNRLYASLGDLDWDSGELVRAPLQVLPEFQIAGKLDKEGFQDAASGKIFKVGSEATQGLEDKIPLFATAQVQNDRVVKILNCSRQFPRTLGSMEESGSFKNASSASMAASLWQLPAMPGAENTIMRFFPAEGREENSGDLAGDVEISGPGIRAEGKFLVEGHHLRIKLDEESRRNLVAVGAPELARAVHGEFVWDINGNALTLEREDGFRLCMLAR